MRCAATKPAPVGPIGLGPVASYVSQLAAYEASRRAADDILLRKMADPRDAMTFRRPL